MRFILSVVALLAAVGFSSAQTTTVTTTTPIPVSTSTSTAVVTSTTTQSGTHTATVTGTTTQTEVVNAGHQASYVNGLIAAVALLGVAAAF